MAEQITFFDSNILIAALVARHDHHDVASSCLAAIPAGFGACAAHSLPETYNTLTQSPRGYGVPALDALKLLRQVGMKYSLISLTSDETLHAIGAAAAQGLAGPIIYDALLIACARKVNAQVICTKNQRHLRMVAPDLATRIFEP
jgi:predicted nucleic acid-binding protein